MTRTSSAAILQDSFVKLELHTKLFGETAILKTVYDVRFTDNTFLVILLS